jgi:hypothetical protein
MRTLTVLPLCWGFAFVGAAGSVSAQSYAEDGGGTPAYEVFDVEMGSAGLIGDEVVLVVPEPAPVAVIEQAPPVQAPEAFIEQPLPPYEGAIWVDGHWSYAGTELVWLEGHYVPPLAGFVFVAPRWVVSADRYYYFQGYYRPCPAYVQTYFNPLYFYPPHPYAQYLSPPRYDRYAYRPVFGVEAPRSSHGPYWPVGAPGQARAVFGPSVAPSRSFQPVGAPTSSSRGGAWPSAFPSSSRAPAFSGVLGAPRGFTPSPSRSFGAGRGRR